MELEILHITKGDKKKKLDTDTPEGRAQVGDILRAMMVKGTALFLERGKKTYRIQGYDPAEDKLLITVETKTGTKTTSARGRKSKVAAVGPVRGGSNG